MSSFYQVGFLFRRVLAASASGYEGTAEEICLR
jgi:hypothetical protein